MRATDAVEDAAGRTCEITVELVRAGNDVELTRPIFVPGAEVVFYPFNGSAEAVRAAWEHAQVPFERIAPTDELEQPIGD